MPDYHWPPMDKRRVMGKRTTRLDGVQKATGRAKYSSDLNRPGLLHGVILTCPHAHARVTSIDTSAAEKTKGVTAVTVISKPGTEIQWEGTEVAAVAAVSEPIALDALRKIKVDYEVLPHLVNEEDLKKAGGRAKASGEQITGDPDKAFQEADAVSEGLHGIPVLNHCCLETHGQAISWQGDKIEFWPSTQSVSTIGGELGKLLELPATNIHVQQDHIGGGFGSKFGPDRWGAECARLSKASGGKPVKLFLDRATEQKIAGNRPSDFARIKIGMKKDGTIVAWQSENWGTGGFAGGPNPPIPYPNLNIPNRRMNHTAVPTNCGPQRAWRAPNHPQASFLTCSALADAAAKINMDEVDFFKKAAELTPRAAVYQSQLDKAADIIEWKKKWHPRGQGQGTVRRGLGVGWNTWQGGGHASQCRCNIRADGTVEVELGSQDLGTGTRTIIAMVAAETLGLPVGAIRLKIGDNRYPTSGSSGGSTTVGGVSTSTRKATMNALEKLYEIVAPSLGAQPDQLEAVDNKIRVKDNPAKSLTWRAACQKLGVRTISEMGANDPKTAAREGLNTAGVGGVQIAEVSVDTETGVVKLEKLVAVQDCGLIINPKTAESQVYGACIMSVCGALMEHRIMDDLTGRVMNPDMEFYKLATLGDIGEIIVHLDITPEHDKRGVIGLGEPPVVGGLGAIRNAVSNAIGVGVPVLPLTPRHVLEALERRNA